MRKMATTIGIGLATLLLAGCAAPPLSPTDTITEAPEAVAAAATIQSVWAKIGCREDDPIGTRGIIDLQTPKPPLEHNGSCTPYEGGEMAFFYELEDATAALGWLNSGGLEIGATDAVFTDGAVVVLATDAATAQKFGRLFTPYH